MLELYQAEWCPYSRQVRQKLTALGVDYVARQVEPSSGDRDRLREATGQDSIPAVGVDGGTGLGGETDESPAELDGGLEPGGWAEGHREQAAAHRGVRLREH